MKKSLLVVIAVMFAVVAGAVDPKVGCTISFMDSHNFYRSNAFFRERPIAEQMIKDGIDLCLYNGWKSGKVEEWKSGAVWSLKQFNAIWLITEHEGMCPYPAQETAAALKAYVEQGGGIVFCFSPGRYPEAPVDAYWTEVMRTFGAEILHEELDSTDKVTVDKSHGMFYTTDLKPHPVTAGVPGLWIVDYQNAWGSAAVKYSSDWQIVVTGGKGSLSRPKNRRTNEIVANVAGTYSHDAPASARLPDVMRLVDDKAYFVVHAPRQCGKTTAFQALTDEINAKGERVALYCSVEAVQEFPDPLVGLPELAGQIRDAVQACDKIGL